MYLTGELSFGSGDARLIYGAATGLLLMSTDTSDGGIPGVAGSFTVSSGGGIGLPNMGTLFSATGSVSIMFNTTLRGPALQDPRRVPAAAAPGRADRDRHLRLGPRPRRPAPPDAPAGGEIYVKATIQAQLTIGGVLTLNGFIGLTAAIGPDGRLHQGRRRRRHHDPVPRVADRRPQPRRVRRPDPHRCRGPHPAHPRQQLHPRRARSTASSCSRSTPSRPRSRSRPSPSARWAGASTASSATPPATWS